MGLDVYLYEKKNWKKETAENDEGEAIEFQSPASPDHLFHVGYFRSSYNDGGINSVMRRAGLPDLYDIFEVGDEYYFAPNWSKALENVKNALSKIKAYVRTDAASFEVMDIDTLFCRENRVQDTEQALNAFMNEWQRGRSDFSAYSNRLGMFNYDGLTCYGFIAGIRFNNTPTIYVIFKARDDKWDWYIRAYEIVQETIEYVLAQPNPQDFYFHWSG